MIRAAILRVFGRRCRKHGVSYRSDLCPQCVQIMAHMLETRDYVSREAGSRPAVRRQAA